MAPLIVFAAALAASSCSICCHLIQLATQCSNDEAALGQFKQTALRGAVICMAHVVCLATGTVWFNFVQATNA
jgi:hypothetical protein